MGFSQTKWVFLKNSHYLIRLYGFLSGKVGFSEKKPTLSADNVGFFFQKNPVYLKNCLDERMFTPVGEGGSGRKASATEDS